MRTLLLTAVMTALTISSVTAHPGHGHLEHQTGPMHYLASPAHLVPLMAVAIVTIVVLSVCRKRVHARRDSDTGQK